MNPFFKIFLFILIFASSGYFCFCVPLFQGDSMFSLNSLLVKVVFVFIYFPFSYLFLCSSSGLLSVDSVCNLWVSSIFHLIGFVIGSLGVYVSSGSDAF